MKKAPAIALLVAPIIILLAAVSFFLFSTDTNYFENTTKIKFPKSTKKIEVFDNGEFVKIGKYLIVDKSESEDMINSYGFKQLEKQQKKIIEFDTFLSKKNQVVYGKDSLFHVSSKSETNSWNILIDKSSGELWIEVLYPDLAGT